ncbi:unnamed protein product, partial [Bubo scandiacus]
AQTPSYAAVSPFRLDQFLQPVKVSLDSRMTLWYMSQSSHFCVIIKLVEGTLCLIIQLINEDTELDWAQY